MELRWSPEAAEDLERIFERIQNDNPTAAREIVKTRSKRNVVQSHKFSELLMSSIRKHQNRAIEATQCHPDPADAGEGSLQ